MTRIWYGEVSWRLLGKNWKLRTLFDKVKGQPRLTRESSKLTKQCLNNERSNLFKVKEKAREKPRFTLESSKITELIQYFSVFPQKPLPYLTLCLPFAYLYAYLTPLLPYPYLTLHFSRIALL